jgi:hypothetical protein
MRKKVGCYLGRHEWLGFRRPDGETFSACKFCLKDKRATSSREGVRSTSTHGRRR